ncbi:MAG: hypothetical protein Hens3KO_27970 [Henriciella sp.]
MAHRLVAVFLLIGLMTACTTVPDPCTPEWAEYKTERVLQSFASDHRGEVRRLKSFADTLEDGEIGPITAMRIPGMIEDFKVLAGDFENTALTEINLALEQCGTAEMLVPAFSRFLRKQDVGDSVIEWVKLLGAMLVETDA